MRNCENAIEAYIKYLADGFTVEVIEESACRVTTPFWLPDRDHIEFFIEIKDNNYARLSDRGFVSDTLFIAGYEIQGHNAREENARKIASKYGVHYQDGILSLVTAVDSLDYSIHLFITTLKAIGQLLELRQQRSQKSFSDEVALYLEENNQNYYRN